MADLPENPPETSPFSRPYEVDTLPANRIIKFDLSPSVAEAEAIAAQLGLTGLKKMRISGAITPMGTKSWVVDADLGATVSQTCVISADPIRTRIDIAVRVKFIPEDKIDYDTPESELDDEVEALGKFIDAGQIAIEALTLAIPLYPRKEGVETQNTQSAPDGRTPMTDAEIKPFAGLAALKGKLENKPE
ncbi:MAG: DUF177 domain-containing protein [Rhodobacteraceae bacterium]|nr:DUF177 domain-containing protein [Paracoccaceae bacterium]